jgi:hypothetical protein
MAGDISKSEVDLRYWLYEEDIYTSRHTREWLARTDPREAAELLERIAQDAEIERLSPLKEFLMGMAVAFTTSSNLLGNAHKARKCGVRAALILAEMGNPRAIPPLVRILETDGRPEGKYQPHVEAALLRLLASKESNLPRYVPQMRDMLERIWRRRGGKGDIPARLAALLEAALPHIRGSGDPESRELLDSLASSSATGRNRAKIQQIARHAADTMAAPSQP